MTQSLPPKSLVLYADDDADDRDLIIDAFSEFSSVIELVTFPSGRELLAFVEGLARLQPKPCLIILDINMPYLDGKQTLHHIRAMEEFQEVPVVLFTTSTLPSEISFAKNYSAGFVTKPLHTRQIQLIIHELIDHCTDEVKEKIRKQREN